MDNYDKLFDKILSEIKETEKRDLNNANEDIHDITYQPGFVKLVKNKFSFDFQKNDEIKSNILHNKYGANLKVADTTPSKSNDLKLTSNIHYGDLFCKNIVSDTRRVFESIIPKDPSNISKFSNNSSSSPKKSFDKLISNYNHIKNVSNIEENANLITKSFISKELLITKKSENNIVEHATGEVIEFSSLRSKDSAEYDDKNRSYLSKGNNNFMTGSIGPKDHSIISKFSNNSSSSSKKSFDKLISNYNFKNVTNIEGNTNLITESFISKENNIVEHATCDVIDFTSLKSKDSAEYDHENRSSLSKSDNNFRVDNSNCPSKMNLPLAKATLSKSFVFNACDFKKSTVDMRVNILIDDSINDEFISDKEISIEIIENNLTNTNCILKPILKNNTTEIKNKTFKTCRFADDKVIEIIHVYENEYSSNNDDEFNDILCDSQNQKINWKHEIGHSRLINNHENISENKKIEFKSDLLF